jgi:hypothetical protein
MATDTHEVPVLIAIRDEDMPRFKEVVARLEHKGLHTHSEKDKMATLGIVRGTALPEVVEELRKDKAVADLKHEGTYTLGPFPPKAR